MNEHTPDGSAVLSQLQALAVRAGKDQSSSYAAISLYVFDDGSGSVWIENSFTGFRARLFSFHDCQEFMTKLQKEVEKEKGGMTEQEERQRMRHLLAWFIEQFQGESGAGENHWQRYPEFVEAQLIVRLGNTEG